MSTIFLIILLNFSFVFAYPVIPSGPWKTSGADFYIETGSIGVGTTTPSQVVL